MAVLRHELWAEPDGKKTFCLAGPDGDGARSWLAPGSRLVWTVDAGSHFEAMTAYYEHMGWGAYRTDHEWDRQPYPALARGAVEPAVIAERRVPPPGGQSH